MNSMINKTIALVGILFFALTSGASQARSEQEAVRVGTEKVGELDIFFREAGDPNKPAIVLLHGLPTSSHMYREVLRALSNDYYLIAPDYPGFGDSSTPAADKFDYTFDNLANVMNTFLEQKGIKRYSMMMMDYGAPIGYRIAMAHPERVQTLIVQNGNAYIEGFGEAENPVGLYWKDKSPELEKVILDNVLSYEGIKWQYTHGTRNPEGISPENWNLDYFQISRPGQDRIQLDLLYDYQHNLKLYPQWQQYLRDNQPPVLLVWGKNDPFFLLAGAEAYKRDVKDLDYNIYDTGHFALEEDHVDINKKIRAFLKKRKIR